MKMRFTIYAFGREVEGKWKPYTEELFTMLCKAYAEQQTMFTVEFDNGSEKELS